MSRTRVALLGATGSIGQSAADVLRRHRDRFEVVALAARRSVEAMVPLCREFSPKLIAMEEPEAAKRLGAEIGQPVESTWEGVRDCAVHPDVDVVLAAIVGAAGLRSTFAAVQAGKTVALANKESLVVGGDFMVEAARKSGTRFLPVDSEHSAIYQCLAGSPGGVRRILLTASGGPFAGKTRDELSTVTREQALKHPNWSMGQKITIDSATLMNKGLEVIEARWLFDVSEDQIDVVVHRQSIVHSMVEFDDGQVMAQLGQPDMRGPIAYALGDGERLDICSGEGAVEPLDFFTLRQLTFEAPDDEAFPALSLARQALRTGGTAPLALSAANEVAVEAFLAGGIGFLAISDIAGEVLAQTSHGPISGIEEALAADLAARQLAHTLAGTKSPRKGTESP